MVTPDEIKSILEVYDSGPDKERRGEATRRLMLDGDGWHDVVRRSFNGIYQPKTIERVQRHVTTAVNLQQRVTDRLAIAYRRQPRRELVKAGQSAQRTLLDAFKETRLAAVMPSIGRYAWLLGRVGLMFDEEKKARLVYPSNASVIVEDEHSDPSVVLYECKGGLVIMTATGVCELDERRKVVKNESHGLGRVPIEWAHVTLPSPGDWWCASRGRKLSDATLAIARVQATMSWIRSQQNHKVLEYTGENPADVVPATGHLPDSEVVTASLPSDVRVSIHDLAIDPKPFIDEIRWHIEAVAEQYGIPSSLIDQDTSSTNAGVWSPDAKTGNTRLLAELRDDQVQYLQAFEIEAAVLLAKHTGALKEDVVRKKFAAHWPPVVGAQDPESRVKSYNAMLTLGLISPAQAYQLEYPTVTVAEAEAAQKANLEARADMIDFMTKRNMPADANHDADTLPQKQGSTGGRPAEDSTNDERRTSDANTAGSGRAR